jgi:hypothetical protein
VKLPFPLDYEVGEGAACVSRKPHLGFPCQFGALFAGQATQPLAAESGAR